MCGIFSVIQKNATSTELQPFDLKKIYDEFIKSKGRGPEHSYMTDITTNIVFGFHRLAINGLNAEANQPIVHNGIYLICNGEVYNYKQLYNELGINGKTDSDCEIIIHMYEKFGIEYTLENIDGYFGFVLYDKNKDEIFVARDPFGVRPVFFSEDNDSYYISSEMKQIHRLTNGTVEQFLPGSYISISNHNNKYTINYQRNYFAYNTKEEYFNMNNSNFSSCTAYDYYCRQIYWAFCHAIAKRVNNTDRKVACLLSGGLDSSIVAALVSRFAKYQVETYSIGIEGGEDFKYAKMVSEHIGSKHSEIVFTEKEFIEAVPTVIEKIESYDTTSVRASVGNYLVSKYISEHSDAKVLFNGDGSDELMGGYLYFHFSPSNQDFDYECKRLLKQIHYFDVLRSDRSISSNGLEARTPFLDKTFVRTYLQIPIQLRNHNNLFWLKDKNIEKCLFRKSMEDHDPMILPGSVLWRTKEAFSDGISSANKKAWYEQLSLKPLPDNVAELYPHNTPTTSEQLYYREIFEEKYPGRSHVIPHFWMPRFCDASDASARTLDIYKEKMDNNTK